MAARKFLSGMNLGAARKHRIMHSYASWAISFASLEVHSNNGLFSNSSYVYQFIIITSIKEKIISISDTIYLQLYGQS